MLTNATVNYHVKSDVRQAYHIDANGDKGTILSPVLIPTKVEVQDLRDVDVVAGFLSDSVLFLKRPSEVRNFNDSNDWHEVYNKELQSLLAQHINAKEVIVFDHTLRIDNPHSERKPARNVHSDYSPLGAQQRLKDLVGADFFNEWNQGHYGFVNAWRPVKNTIYSAPLGFVRPQSATPQDWLTLDLIYPNRVGQIMGLVANDAHEWFYLSEMTPDEVAIFNIYDNRGLPSVAHSALDLGPACDNAKRTVRMSIESRTLVRY